MRAVAALAALACACATTQGTGVETSSEPTGAQQAAALKEKATQAYDHKQYAESYSLFNQAYALEPLPATAFSIACTAALLGQKDNAFEWLHTAIDEGFTAAAWLRDPDLASLKTDSRWDKLPARMKPVALAHAKERNVGGGLTRTTPEAAGLDGAALKRVLDEAEKSHTTALVVLRDGKLVGDWYFGNWTRPIEAMSATKSVVALAIGFLLDDKKLKSLDEPLWHFFPELRQGLKEKLTVRHVLTHTSGIQAQPSTEEIYRASNFVQLALSADLETEPGARFQYNNKAVNLLAGVVEKASGQKLDAYLNDKLFEPLGIKDVQWTLDKAGNPHAMSGLQIHPLDFAKVGQFVLDGGKWEGKPLLSSAFLDEATKSPGQQLVLESGLLWWLSFEKTTREVPAGASAALASRQADPALIKAVKGVEGKVLEVDVFWNQLGAALPSPRDKERLVMELEKVGTPMKRAVAGSLKTIEARGFLGQYLIIHPASRLVAVRMVEADDGVPEEALSFPGFGPLVGKLVTKN